MSKFILNKLASHLSILGNSFQIPSGGHVELGDDLAASPELTNLINLGYLGLSDTEPGTPASGTPLKPIELENDKLKGSITPPSKAAVQEPVEVKVVEAPVPEDVKVAEKPAAPVAKKAST